MFIDIFKMLLEAKTNLDLRDKYGDTPLIWAAKHARPEFVEVLLGYGADPDAQNSQNGRTALMNAIERIWMNNNYSKDIVEILLKAEAYPNAQDTNGNTALILASLIPNANIVETLLEAGADPYKRNKQDKAALRITKTMRSLGFLGGSSSGVLAGLTFLLGEYFISFPLMVIATSTLLSYNKYSPVIRALKNHGRQKQPECPTALSD